MAIIIPGGAVSAISGSIGGTNFVRGKQCTYSRNAYSGRKGTSEIQLNHRRGMKIASKFWQSMTPDRRASWRSIASTIPALNRFGISRFLTGYQLFCRYVLENHDREKGFNISCNIIGETPKPIIGGFIVTKGGSWDLLTELGYWTGSRVIKIFASRPVRNSPILHFSNWFLIFWDVEPQILFKIQEPPNVHIRLVNCEADEWVALKILRRMYPTSGRMLYSAPTYISRQVQW